MLRLHAVKSHNANDFNKKIASQRQLVIKITWWGYIREELLCSGASYSEELLSDEPFLIAPLGCRHYRMLNGFSAGHVRGYRHARATSLYTIM